MAIMVPDFNDKQLSQFESHGEVKVFTALKLGLPDSYLVFSQVAWILRNENEQAKDGEADFVICHPNYGYICIEVKGGGIIFDSSTKEWFSINYLGEKNTIKDPIEQARKSKFSILKKLKENPAWNAMGNIKICIGHAVLFPDVEDVTGFVRPDMDKLLIGKRSDLCDAKRWVDNCFTYWTNNDHSISPIGMKGISIFKETFAKSFTLELSVSAVLNNEEKMRIALTEQQIRIIDFIKKKRRAIISGGAGTGKTIIAQEKAKKLAIEGFRTLLVCYNRPLAEYLKNLCAGIDRLDVMSFHQLCHGCIEVANKMSGRDLLDEAKKTYPGKDLYDVQFPNAFAYSLDIIPDRYDAIVCDEGQDFREEFWLPLEMMLADYDSSPFYIFYDDNQNLYSRVSTFPIEENEEYFLSKNCRNTVQIHKAAYRYYKGNEVEHSNIDGKEIVYELGVNVNKQAGKIYNRILELLDEKVDVNKIVILIADAIKKKNYIEALQSYSFPKSVVFAVEDENRIGKLLITTVNRFKGLEAEVVFLWGLNYVNLNEFREQLYVGISRAKSMTYIVGNKEECSHIQENLEERVISN